MKGGESMTEQEKQKIQEAKEKAEKMLTDFFSSFAKVVRESAKALQSYPDKRVVNKAIHGRTEKIRRRNLKKILDWYKKQNP